MTKQDVQSKVNEMVSAIHKQHKLDGLNNEGRDGYYDEKAQDAYLDYIMTVREHGFYVTADKKVIDADDFAAYREAFNAAIRAGGNRPNVPAIENKVGISHSDLRSAKEVFVA